MTDRDMFDAAEMKLDHYIEMGEYVRRCFDSGSIDDYGDCKICGVPAGTGGCTMCLHICAANWALEDYADGL